MRIAINMLSTNIIWLLIFIVLAVIFFKDVNAITHEIEIANWFDDIGITTDGCSTVSYDQDLNYKNSKVQVMALKFRKLDFFFGKRVLSLKLRLAAAEQSAPPLPDTTDLINITFSLNNQTTSGACTLSTINWSTETVQWVMPRFMLQGATYETPDIKELLFTSYATDLWRNEGVMELIIAPTSLQSEIHVFERKVRTFESAENDLQYHPTLLFNYEVPEWTQWSAWSACTANDGVCGNGQIWRKRVKEEVLTFSGNLHNQEQQDTQACYLPCSWDTVDGGWSHWYVADSCNTTCGTGVRTLSRLCTAPVPANGGMDCVGDDTLTETCSLSHCNGTVDGGWSPWYVSSQCNNTCGTGIRSISRLCTSPPPINGGSFCVGINSKTESCSLMWCNGTYTRDGEWSSWFVTSSCSSNCGTGLQSLTRTCTAPPPINGGLPCVGNATTTVSCTRSFCGSTVNGDWSSWYITSSCNTYCGTGTRVIERTCTSPPPINGGLPCVGSNTSTTTCTGNWCGSGRLDGQWSSWFVSTSCSTSCGTGERDLARTCTAPPPLNGGIDCIGNNTKTIPCYSNWCDGIAVDGEWSTWFMVSSCSTNCGTGTRNIQRTCTAPPPMNGGQPCTGSSTSTTPCTTNWCGGGTWDGEWSPWFQSSICSTNCGTGQRSVFRTCTSPPPLNGGLPCAGIDTKTEMCYQSYCDAVFDGGWSSWTVISQCNVSCGSSGFRVLNRTCSAPSPANGGMPCLGPTSITEMCSMANCNTAGLLNGGWSFWKETSTCTQSCGDGTRDMARYCTAPAPMHGGSNCVGSVVMTESCSITQCSVQGVWSSWYTYVPCQSCGASVETFVRACSPGEATCPGGSYMNRECPSITPCEVTSGWTHWLPSSHCSSTCGTSTRAFIRSCTPGSFCTGANYKTEPCQLPVCPNTVHGGWSSWTEISPCDSCGTSLRLFARSCNSPFPGDGGMDCHGHSRREEFCILPPCPIHGGWTMWAPSSACTSSCGGGTASFTRTCTSPAPMYGGSSCSGMSTKMESCNTHTCPIHGGWSPWTVTGACALCGTSRKVKNRLCDSPAPYYGGLDCVGDEESADPCFNSTPCPGTQLSNIQCGTSYEWEGFVITDHLYMKIDVSQSFECCKHCALIGNSCKSFGVSSNGTMVTCAFYSITDLESHEGNYFAYDYDWVHYLVKK